MSMTDPFFVPLAVIMVMILIGCWLARGEKDEWPE